MNRKAVNTWLKMPERNVFFRGMTTWMGFTSTQIPFEVAARSAGKSGWSTLKRLKLALVGLTAFSSLPLQLVTFAGAIFFGLRSSLDLDLVPERAGRAVSGFARVILLQLIIGSLLMTSLGIIGQYLARIYEEVKGRPRYVVKDSIRDILLPTTNHKTKQSRCLLHARRLADCGGRSISLTRLVNCTQNVKLFANQRHG